MESSAIQEIDADCVVLYLEIPESKVVVLQAYFELYEGLGIVRTLDIKKSLVCILSTPSQRENCLKALESLRSEIKWRFADSLSAEERTMTDL